MPSRPFVSLALGALGVLVLSSWSGCSPKQREFGTGGGGSGSTGTTMGAGGGSSTGSTGGGGAIIACVMASDCPGKETECQSRTCEAGFCGASLTAAGTPIAAQVLGNCHSVACDGKGGLVEDVDNNDVPDDSNPCTDDVCTAGAPANQPVALGASCGGTLTCDSSGHCTGCDNPGQCPGADTDCQQRSCTSSVCGFLYTQAGTPVSSQTPSDCKQNVCNGQGAVSIIFDPADTENDSNDCTLDGCSNGSPTHANLAAGAPCSEAGNTVCNGNGSCVACLIAATCPGKDTECSQRTCNGGACAFAPTAAGTAVLLQTPGDCATNVCDGSGNVVGSPDDGDVPDDGNQCTTDGCSGGTASHTPVAMGTVCGPNQTCNAAGICVGCNVASDCPGQVGECQTPTCNGGECGFTYAPFGTMVAAQAGGDCKKNVCNGQGAVAVVADNGDVPSDGNDCTSDLCSGGSPSNPPAPAGTACDQGGTVCNGVGACNECVPGDSKYCCGVKTSFCCNNPASPPPTPGDPPNIICCCGGTIDCDASGQWGPCFQ